MATDYPVTMAIRALRQHKVDFTPHLYAWEPRGGTRASAEHLGVDEHQVVKTLIFEDEAKRPLCILMHGDREVSAKNLARQLKHKSVAPCAPEVADRHSGYQVGGTSPFGLKRAMPIAAKKPSRICHSSISMVARAASWWASAPRTWCGCSSRGWWKSLLSDFRPDG